MTSDEPPPANESDGDETTKSKVHRLIDEYDLDGMGEQLERYWLGTEGEQHSLRSLAELFNQRVLSSAMADAGLSSLDGEVENLHRLLTDDDVSAGMRTQARNRLARHDIDVEQVERDFVSHVAIHNYLTDVRGVDQPSESLAAGDHVAKERRTIRRLRNRAATVTEQSIDRLRSEGHIALGEFDVLVEFSVACRDCGTSRRLDDLLDRQGCACDLTS